MLSGLDEGIDIADFGFDFGGVGIFFGLVAAIGGSGVLKITEGFGESMVAAAQNPVDDFAFGHGIEVVEAEAIFGNHGIQDIGDELEAGASSRSVIFLAEAEIASGEFGGKFGVLEPELIKTVLVAKDSNIVIETLDVREVPSIKEEVAVAESVFKAVGGKTRNVVVGDGEEFVVGNFAGENAVFLKLASDDTRIADDFAGTRFNRFLVFGVAIEVIDGVLKARASDVMEEAGESLDFVVSEVPDDESNADAVGED